MLSRLGISALVMMLLWPFASHAQDLRQQAERAWFAAQEEDQAFQSLPPEARTRNEHLRIIHLYERVYLITPHSGYADDALLRIATLYEDTGADKEAITTLRFLVSDYPASRHIPVARERIARLTGAQAGETETASARDPDHVWVDNIRYWESEGSLRVVVDTEGPPIFTRGEAYDPPRVYLDVTNARLSPELGQREFPIASGLLHGIRVGQYDVNTVRVVLDLAELRNVETFTLADPNRIVMDVLGQATPTVTSTVPVSPAAEPVVESVVTDSQPGSSPAPDRDTPSVPPVPQEVAVSTPAVPTEHGEHTLSRSLGLKPHRVVIDPGHGGQDPGTIGPSGLSEAELVLDLAKRLKERIQKEIPNAEVVLTRDSDTFVPLESRSAAANQAEADLFVSIHANSSRTRSIRGVETYFLNLNPSEEAMEIAARENAASERSISDLQDIVSQIMTQEWGEESRELASHVQAALASKTDLGRDRGVKQAPLVVLLGTNMPSILAEVSFISNPDDERLLKGDERRQQIADALFDGIRSYFETLSSFRTAAVTD